MNISKWKQFMNTFFTSYFNYCPLNGICYNYTINNKIISYNCFLTRQWGHKTWNEPYLSNQAVLLHDQKGQTKILNNLTTKRAFAVK